MLDCSLVQAQLYMVWYQAESGLQHATAALGIMKLLGASCQLAMDHSP